MIDKKSNYETLPVHVKEPMRSLYLDDIPGTKPTKRAFDKSSFRSKHNEQIYRFGRSKEQRVIDWYMPMNKVTDPLDRNDQFWINKRTLKKSFHIYEKDLAKSTPLENLIRSGSPKNPEQTLQKSTILTDSGKETLNASRVRDDPYFPHRYIDTKFGEKNRWSGQRSWVEEPTEIIRMPSTKNGYYRNWS